MSLFPAYNVISSKCTEGDSEKDNNAEWLSNRSYKITDVKSEPRERSDDSSTEDLDVVAIDKSRSEAKKTKGKRNIENDDDSGDRNDDNDDRRRKHKKKKKHKKHKHKDHSEAHKDNSDKHHHHIDVDKEAERQTRFPSDARLVQSTINKVFINDIPDLQAEHAFRIDRKPDAQNTTFGELYKLHIAKHHLLTKRCVGSGMTLNDLTKSKKKHEDKRYYHKQNKVKLLDGNTETVNMGKSRFDKTLSVNDNFVPVDSRPTELGKRTYANPLGVYDIHTEAFIKGKDERKNETSDISQEDQGDKLLRAETEKFNISLRENPHNIKLWLDFVAFQDKSIEVLDSADKQSDVVKKKTALSLLEKKLSILDKAIEKNPTDLELAVSRLQICKALWEREKMVESWKKLLFVHNNSPFLWRHYLLFLQADVTGFSSSGILAEYHKCLQALSNIKEGLVATYQPLPQGEHNLLAIFCQMCDFLQQCGQTEKSIASYQALLEFNCFCPDSLQDAPYKDKLAFFEAFWDSGVPRLGEDGSLGWKNCLQFKDKEYPPPMSSISDISSQDLEDNLVKNEKLEKYEKWSQIETNRHKSHWLPWRPNTVAGETEEDCEDPDRMVLYDDITSCLFTIDDANIKIKLIESFLGHLGIYSPISERKNLDNTNFSQLSFSDVQRLEILSDVGMKRVQFCSETLHKFTRNLFQQILPCFSDSYREYLSHLWLQIEIRTTLDVATTTDVALTTDKKLIKQQKKELKKFAKSILKEPENRNSLALYELYGSLEYTLGNKADGRKVFDMSVMMNQSQHKVMNMTNYLLRTQLCKLYRSYLEAELGLREPEPLVVQNDATFNRIVYFLSSISDGSTWEAKTEYPRPSAATILKTRKYLQLTLDKLKQELSVETPLSYPYIEKHGSSIVHWTVCCALFEYLTTDLKTASKVFIDLVTFLTTYSRKLDLDTTGNQVSIDSEHLTLSHMELLQYHRKTNISRIQILRKPLIQANQNYRGNITLLGMYINMEMGSRIMWPIRRFFRSILDNRVDVTKADVTRDDVMKCDVTTWICALGVELQHQKHILEMGNTDGSGSQYARRLFERATDCDITKHCVLIWRLYIRFEVLCGNLDRAKGVFYRALQHCPWTKVLYTDAIQYFPSQLEEIMELMMEKEIRLHLPLEELDILMEPSPVIAD